MDLITCTEPQCLYTSPLYLLLYMGVKLGLSLERHRLGMSESRVLREVFGPKRDEVTGM